MTLLEAMVVIATLSILTAGVTQAVAGTADRAAVVQVQGTVVRSYREAQSVARAFGGRAGLWVSPDSIVIRRLGGDSSIVRRQPGPRGSNVTIAPADYSIVYGPDGLPVGAGNVTIVLSRGTTSRQIVVSRLGRLRLD